MDNLRDFKRVASWKWIRDQYTQLEVPSSDLTGKTVVITGANRGIGFEAAKHFARLNAKHLILACRKVSTGNVAAEQIMATTGCSGAVTCWPLDLASFTSIKQFATRIQQENISIDILVGNAAYMGLDYVQTQDGWETGLQVNCLGNFLLILLLLPHFPRPSETVSIPRVILLSSDSHYFISRLQEADTSNILATLNDPRHCFSSAMRQRYFVSKLLIVLFSRELARRMDPNFGPNVVTVDPGVCITDLYRETAPTFLGRLAMRGIQFLVARTPEVGSRTIVHAAVYPQCKEIHGKYLATQRVKQESDYVTSTEGQVVQRRLWNEIVDILQVVDSRVEGIICALQVHNQ
ncbi:NAD(P)-binding protein [Mycena sanguinolenta]|uniref:NAD(P)-binding protein n=1 Tax=Mycena sanguinolenta TaxID=230812 RepID=A0A8H6YZC9_9AGAR|nr:NAD(P)-binding protein [Mycena sanguinolenta]